MEMPKQGYKVKQYDEPVKRYCQTLDLRDNQTLIKEYRRLHSREAIWPEIVAGIREVGILEMEIYILGTRLFMIVETPLDFDWEESMSRLAVLPRQQEWEDHVRLYQMAGLGAASSQKWKLMERMFYLYD